MINIFFKQAIENFYMEAALYFRLKVSLMKWSNIAYFFNGPIYFAFRILKNAFKLYKMRTY